MGRAKIKDLLQGLTPKQKKFADGLLEGKTGTQAIKDSYELRSSDKDNVAANISSVNLGKAKVIEYLEANGLGAASRIVKLSKEAKNETVQLNANKDILDRTNIGVKNNNVVVPVQINIGSEKDEFR